MIKVITYGTYDLLHYGHIRLLERAKALGDYLIVGVTADDFDKTRGKINVQQSLMERVEAVKATGLADEIIIEEYEGQKIDDIKRYDVDIFTVGSDWKGQFDYLNEYCKVVYLDRTVGVSSTEIRSQQRKIKLGLIGDSSLVYKVANECSFVNGLEICGIFTNNNDLQLQYEKFSFEKLVDISDAIYIISEPSLHYEQIKYALLHRKHVLCETPISLNGKQSSELHEIASYNHCILMDSIKTAYSTAYFRMLLLVKSGKIGDIVSIDATATSLKDIKYIYNNDTGSTWNSICEWGPTVMLPVFQLLGTDYVQKQIISKLFNDRFDLFTQINFIYDNAIASIKVGKGVKSEGELIVSGTKGYVYIPAPWWKTDYFEVRYENAEDNQRFFYQLDGEGIRYEIVAFAKSVEVKKPMNYVEKGVSKSIAKIIESFNDRTDMIVI